MCRSVPQRLRYPVNGSAGLRSQRHRRPERPPYWFPRPVRLSPSQTLRLHRVITPRRGAGMISRRSHEDPRWAWLPSASEFVHQNPGEIPGHLMGKLITLQEAGDHAEPGKQDLPPGLPASPGSGWPRARSTSCSSRYSRSRLPSGRPRRSTAWTARRWCTSAGPPSRARWMRSPRRYLAGLALQPGRPDWPRPEPSWSGCGRR